MVKDIGLNVKAPQAECNDPNCPFHGHLAVRGQLLDGTVVALDDQTLEELWSINVGTGINAHPEFAARPTLTAVTKPGVP